MTWYPSQRKVIYRIDDRVSSNVSSNGLNNFTPSHSTLSAVVAARRRAPRRKKRFFATVTSRQPPIFKRSITFLEKDDSYLGDQVGSFGNQLEFADMTWYPSQRKVIYRIDDRVSSNVSSNGLNNFTPSHSTLSAVVAAVRTAG
ncbi:hypothetical protein TEA_000640 [Camellia sinensis var. sinensis]|uniref:Uncharacterized protein n=1 Tax=Camellia sinensis var. sinensis TaxID=542762 RepID=A0A4S4EI55_CAMSN|nr:hypothetical protein TEA_000640 [Camellia sinensis var. sinensis]